MAPARVAASSRSARVSTARAAHRYETARASRAVRLRRPATLGPARPPRRALRRRERFPRKISHRDSARDSRAERENGAPRSRGVEDVSRFSRKKTSSRRVRGFDGRVERHVARRLTCSLLHYRDERIRTPPPGSTPRSARATHATPRKRTERVHRAVWRRSKPPKNPRLKSRNRKPTASTRANSISTSRSTRVPLRSRVS